MPVALVESRATPHERRVGARTCVGLRSNVSDRVERSNAPHGVLMRLGPGYGLISCAHQGASPIHVPTSQSSCTQLPEPGPSKNLTGFPCESEKARRFP